MSSMHNVSIGEIRLFHQAYQQNDHPKISEDERVVVGLVEEAFKNSRELHLTPESWEIFKALKFKILGPSSLIETFEETMGIPPRTKKLEKLERQYQLNLLRVLVAPWEGQTNDVVTQTFQQLRKDEQKIFLKALAYFSSSDGRMILSERDTLVLTSITNHLQGLVKTKGTTPTGEMRRRVFDYFVLLYPQYKNAVPTDSEKLAMKQVDGIIEGFFDPEFASLGGHERQEALMNENNVANEPFPGPETVSMRKKRELFVKGEKRIEGEILEEQKGLKRGWESLKVRLKENDPNDIALSSDLQTFYEKCRITGVKGETLADVYKSHVRDKDFSFLYGKALIVEAEILDLEAMALWNLEQRGVVSPLSGRESSWNVREKRATIIPEAEIFLERAHYMGHPKAGILLSSFLRHEGDWDDIGKVQELYDRCDAFLHDALARDDVDAKIELARLQTAAWPLYDRIGEEHAVDTLESIGFQGGEALYEHFLAGSPLAADRLLNLMEERKTPEGILREKFERFLASVVNFFTFGQVKIYNEPRFFSRDPKQLSTQEVDFLVQATLSGNMKAHELLERFIQEGFGPKQRLAGAKNLFRSLGIDQNSDAKMVVNSKEAYRHFESTARMLLKQDDLERREFFLGQLDNYLNRIDQDGYPFRLLSGLRDQLRGIESESSVIDIIVEPEKITSAPPLPGSPIKIEDLKDPEEQKAEISKPAETIPLSIFPPVRPFQPPRPPEAVEPNDRVLTEFWDQILRELEVLVVAAMPPPVVLPPVALPRAVVEGQVEGPPIELGPLPVEAPLAVASSAVANIEHEREREEGLQVVPYRGPNRGERGAALNRPERADQAPIDQEILRRLAESARAEGMQLVPYQPLRRPQAEGALPVAEAPINIAPVARTGLEQPGEPFPLERYIISIQGGDPFNVFLRGPEERQIFQEMVRIANEPPEVLAEHGDQMERLLELTARPIQGAHGGSGRLFTGIRNMMIDPQALQHLPADRLLEAPVDDSSQAIERAAQILTRGREAREALEGAIHITPDGERGLTFDAARLAVLGDVFNRGNGEPDRPFALATGRALDGVGPAENFARMRSRTAPVLGRGMPPLARAPAVGQSFAEAGPRLSRALQHFARLARLVPK